MLPSAIIANVTGPEGYVSAESARAVSSVFDIPVIDLATLADIHLLLTIKTRSVFLATHGGFAEDGRLQEALAAYGIAFSHSNAEACRIMSNKHRTKQLFSQLKINTPNWFFGGRWHGSSPHSNALMEKPLSSGSKIGIQVSSFATLKSDFLYEEYINGDLEASAYVLGSVHATALPILVRARSKSAIGFLWDTDRSLSRECELYCQESAVRMHRHLSARGLTKTDFVISSEGKALAIEVDSHPALGAERGAAKSAANAGVSYDEMIRIIINA